MMDFDDIKNNYKNMELELRTSSSRISRTRLIVFAIGTALVIYFMRTDSSMNTFLSIIGFVIVFSWLVSRHNKILASLERVKSRINIVDIYKDRLGENWSNHSDDGSEFVDKNHQYCIDLDLFGKNSLFQWMNNCKTYFGRNYLSKLLMKPDKEIGLIKERQGQIAELGAKFEFCEKLMCEAMITKNIGLKPEKLLDYAENTEYKFKREWTINMFYALPFFTILLSALVLMKFKIPVFIPYILILIQMALSGIGYLKFQQILSSVNSVRDSINAYEKLIALAEGEKFENESLKKLQNTFFKNGTTASKGLKSLNRISDFIDFRYNPILYFILNITLLWDYHCIFMMEEWKRKYGMHLREWLICIGELEALSSLSVPIHLGISETFPEFVHELAMVSAQKLGHPLIEKNKRVNNDITMFRNQCIVTGSNMSGKTTMLRTIGVNLVLAYAGAPVYADSFKCSIMEIFTSMRVADDLGSGISTFYAELLRIKMLIEYSKQKKPMIYLIDEIFRGTNSVDRITGAMGLLRNLNKSWITGLITTHDFELCELGSSSSSIVNYHFEESYKENKIIFDYKLRSGRSNTTNAKYLMKMVGLDIENDV